MRTCYSKWLWGQVKAALFNVGVLRCSKQNVKMFKCYKFIEHSYVKSIGKYKLKCLMIDIKSGMGFQDNYMI